MPLFIEKHGHARTRDDVRIEDKKLRDALAGTCYMILDGGMGSMIQARGLVPQSSIPDMLSIEMPAEITSIHQAYVNAGAQAVTTNTFGASKLKLHGAAPVQDVIEAGLACAKASGAPYVGLSMGPLGALLKPMGELSFDDAYEYFAEQVRAAMAAQEQPSFFLVETMSDLLEIKAAVLAIKEHADLPIIACMTFDADGHTLMGTTPQIAALTLEALGVHALGINCSVGPDAVAPFAAEMRKSTSLPLIAQPNAGLPRVINGETTYTYDVNAFIDAYAAILDAGASIIGSCCGSTPEYTQAIATLIAEKAPVPLPACRGRFATSVRMAVNLEELDRDAHCVALNCDGQGDIDDIMDEVFDAAGSDARLLVLDVDALQADDIPEAVSSIQSVSALPLAFKGSSAQKLEAAARAYAGIPALINASDAEDGLVLAIARHYGASILELD